jgi:hypothetical protein
MTSFLVHNYGEHRLWSAPLGGTISILQPLGEEEGQGQADEEGDGVTLAVGQRCATPSPNAVVRVAYASWNLRLCMEVWGSRGRRYIIPSKHIGNYTCHIGIPNLCVYL